MGLLPAPAELRDKLEAHGLGPHVKALAAESSYKTGVIVKNLSAARTGAEVGNLLLEAPWADLEVSRARVERIRDGLEVFTETSLTAQLVGGLEAQVVAGDPWVAVLQGRHDGVAAAVQANREHPQLPLVLAGGWLQASWLTASALERAGDPAPAHALLYRPEIGAYFQSYVETRGRKDFPDAVLSALSRTLRVMETQTAKDPMTMEDVTTVRRSVESLLNSM